MVSLMRVSIKAIVLVATVAFLAGCASSPSPHLQQGAEENVQRTFFVTDAPTDKYFRVLREASCDDWLTLRPLTPEIAKSWYGKGDVTPYRGGDFVYLCKGLFEDLLKEQQDPRILSADAVIFNPETADVDTKMALWLTRRKVHMQGWAVQYIKPDLEEVLQRLGTEPKTAIEKVQFKAAAKWLRAHPGAQAVPMLSDLIKPKIGAERYDDAFATRLDLLAILDTSSSHDELWRSLVQEGLGVPHDRYPPKGHRYNVGRVPLIAVHALVCRNPQGTRELLQRLLLDPAYIQYKYAAARGLLALGDAAFLKAGVAKGKFPGANSFVDGLLQVPDDSKLSCPYNGLYMENP